VEKMDQRKSPRDDGNLHCKFAVVTCLIVAVINREGIRSRDPVWGIRDKKDYPSVEFGGKWTRV
jgi:hypothetical protein